MELHIIETGNFKLDGGAMFGVVPKSIWQRTNPADNNNMCSWAMRCLLIKNGDRLILIDTGIGNKQSDKFYSYYYLFGDHSLQSSIEAKGFSIDEVTDVVLTHLHFDHCGGAIVRNVNGTFEPFFKNATFWSNDRHWKWATEPNAREKASFLSENILPIQESGQLKFIQRENTFFSQSPFENISFVFADGHTDAQMLPVIDYQGQKIVFMADLLPSVGHIPLPYVMGYDTRPLLTLEEKKLFLDKAAQEEFVLFLEHDFENECCMVKQTEKGVRLDKTFKLEEIG